MNLRLKQRIVWFNTIAVAMTISAVSLIIYIVVYSTSFRQLDEDIRTESDEALTNINWKGDSIIIYNLPEWDEAEHTQAELIPLFIQVNDLRGRIIFRTRNLANDKLSIADDLKTENFFNGNIRAQHIRHGQFPIINDAGKRIGTLLVGIPADTTFRVLKNLRLALLIAFPVLLLIIFVVTSFAASRGISPVYGLIDSTSAIDDSTIHTRLNLPASHDEVFTLATTINALLDRIEHSVLLQKQFTSDASHELRTPISAIRGNLEVLIRKPHAPEYYESKVREVIRQADRLNFLIDQLLQLTRLDAGSVIMKREKINLRAFISDVTEKWKGKLEDHEMSLRIEIGEEAFILGDQFYLGVVLDNLVSNAIKYGNNKGKIRILWSSENRSLTIADDGPGIPAEFLPRIFDRFFRADSSRNSNIEGNGLGLALVKKLTDIQKIIISVRSKVGEGTEFDLKFT